MSGVIVQQGSVGALRCDRIDALQGLCLRKTGVDRALMVGSIILILIVEILNSALEAVVDKASPEKHELAKRAKDMGSAAVLLSLINAAVVWACVLWPGGHG